MIIPIISLSQFAKLMRTVSHKRYCRKRGKKVQEATAYICKCYSSSWDFVSEKLGCSRYNCRFKGSLFIDLIGVINGGCCHCCVFVGIHDSESLLVPTWGREWKYAVISHLQPVKNEKLNIRDQLVKQQNMCKQTPQHKHTHGTRLTQQYVCKQTVAHTRTHTQKQIAETS